MNIIGHRGAAGLALENTAESIQTAKKTGVDGIEFDIRVTKDGQIVLNHDKHLGRVSQESAHIRKFSLRKLRSVFLHNGQTIATLGQAIKLAGNIPLVIEGKDSGWAGQLAQFLQKQKKLPACSVISFNHQELYEFHTLLPSVPVYALEHTNPFEVIRTARILDFTGIDINFWILNPLTYALARFHKLDIIVYTVNRPVLARFLRILYPRISITTDVPDQLQFLRKTKRIKKLRPKNP